MNYSKSSPGTMGIHDLRIQTLSLQKYLSAGTGKEGTLVRIDISSFESKRHFLLIHEKRNHVIDVNDVIVIENLIRSLQFELLREFSGKQRQLSTKTSHCRCPAWCLCRKNSYRGGTTRD